MDISCLVAVALAAASAMTFGPTFKSVSSRALGNATAGSSGCLALSLSNAFGSTQMMRMEGCSLSGEESYMSPAVAAAYVAGNDALRTRGMSKEEALAYIRSSPWKPQPANRMRSGWKTLGIASLAELDVVLVPFRLTNADVEMRFCAVKFYRNDAFLVCVYVDMLDYRAQMDVRRFMIGGETSRRLERLIMTDAEVRKHHKVVFGEQNGHKGQESARQCDMNGTGTNGCPCDGSAPSSVLGLQN